jgi:hypothetical protein
MYPEKVLRHTASLWVSAVRVICRSLSGEFVVFWEISYRLISSGHLTGHPVKAWPCAKLATTFLAVESWR